MITVIFGIVFAACAYALTVKCIYGIILANIQSKVRVDQFVKDLQECKEVLAEIKEKSEGIVIPE